MPCTLPCARGSSRHGPRRLRCRTRQRPEQRGPSAPGPSRPGGRRARSRGSPRKPELPRPSRGHQDPSLRRSSGRSGAPPGDAGGSREGPWHTQSPRCRQAGGTGAGLSPVPETGSRCRRPVRGHGPPGRSFPLPGTAGPGIRKSARRRHAAMNSPSQSAHRPGPGTGELVPRYRQRSASRVTRLG